MENELVGVLAVKVKDELVAVVYNDIAKRRQVFYSCKEMGAEDIKQLLDSKNEPKA